MTRYDILTTISHQISTLSGVLNRMRILKIVFALAFLAATLSPASAQEVFTSERIDYSIELPSPTWRVISEPDAAHEHLEFVYGDRLEGYLQIRKEVVDSGMTTLDLAHRDRDQKLRFMCLLYTSDAADERSSVDL